MSTSPNEILALANQAKNFVPETDRRPSVFLSLAPATSASYPQRKASVTAEPATPAAAEAAEAAATAEAHEHKQRRSSSLSSTASSKSSAGFRFLKLGPVHWGEHLGEHKEDWHEAAIE